MKTILILILLVGIGIGVGQVYRSRERLRTTAEAVAESGTRLTVSSPEPLPPDIAPEVVADANLLPERAFITLPSYVSQTFNNCSMAAFSMLLSHYGVHKGQAELAELIRPWNNPKGDNDDKSTVFEEIEPVAREFNFTPYYRPNGRTELLHAFIAHDIPVMVRTLTRPYEDYLHFRVVVGYDRAQNELIIDDSMQGKGLRLSPEAFDAVWREFNYQYMVLAKTSEQQKTIEGILSEETDRQTAWRNALLRALEAVAQNPDDLKARYNALTARYELGDYEKVVRDFEAIESELSKYKLWYQIEPIEAYFKLGKYDRVLELADKVLGSNNKAVSELYLLKGKVYQARGDRAAARAEYEKAVLYNANWKPAQNALASLDD